MRFKGFQRSFGAAALLVFAVVFASGCQHVTRVESDVPGATVTKDGRVIGTAPVDVPVKIGSMFEPDTITITKGNATRTVAFDKSEYFWPQGVFSAVSMLASGFFIVGGLALLPVNTYVGGLAIITGLLAPVAAVGYFFFLSWRMPETVRMNLRDELVTTSNGGPFVVVGSSGIVGDARPPAASGPARVVPARGVQARPKAEPAAPGPAQGIAGGACYGNGTCNAGLECLDSVCRATAEAGKVDGPCYGNGTCNKGLTCSINTCRAPAEGAEDGACYGNGTCNEGLTCADGRCTAAD